MRRNGRLDHVGAILADRAPRGPLLATPTDVDGWIDPHVLVDRLAATTRFSPADLVGALLRPAPDGRPAALRRLERQDRTDEIGDAIAAVGPSRRGEPLSP